MHTVDVLVGVFMQSYVCTFAQLRPCKRLIDNRIHHVNFASLYDSKS